MVSEKRPEIIQTVSKRSFGGSDVRLRVLAISSNNDTTNNVTHSDKG